MFRFIPVHTRYDYVSEEKGQPVHMCRILRSFPRSKGYSSFRRPKGAKCAAQRSA